MTFAGKITPLILFSVASCTSTRQEVQPPNRISEIAGFWSGYPNDSGSHFRIAPDGKLTFTAYGCLNTEYQRRRGSFDGEKLVLNRPVYDYLGFCCGTIFRYRQIDGIEYLLPGESGNDDEADLRKGEHTTWPGWRRFPTESALREAVRNQ